MEIKTPTTNAQRELLRAVEDITAIYPEGESFFDALDEFIINMASPEIYSALFDMTGLKPLILTGGFGKRIAHGIDNGEFPSRQYILFKGGLRKGNQPEIIKFSIDEFPKDNKFAFIDDTIYAGGTFNKIKDFLKENDIMIDICTVVYDGCPIDRNHVQSIFRYYDYFTNVKPNFEFHA